MRQLGIVKALQERGTTVLDPVAPSYGLAEFKEEMIMPTLLKATLGSDVFISGTNALTEDGKLVNIDGLGNRMAGIMFGARTSIVVVGRNKLVKNVDEALNRIRNTITPALTKRRELPLPCAKTGKCVDCNMPERACNITVIIEKKPPLTDLKVIVVNDDLGLGWDPDWPQKADRSGSGKSMSNSTGLTCLPGRNSRRNRGNTEHGNKTMRFEGRETARPRYSVHKKGCLEGARKPTERWRRRGDSEPVRRNGNEEKFTL